jgi:hypothetical protein
MVYFEGDGIRAKFVQKKKKKSIFKSFFFLAKYAFVDFNLKYRPITNRFYKRQFSRVFVCISVK